MAFDQCIYYDSADAARVLIQIRDFEGYDRDIILGAAKHKSVQVLRMAYELGRCRFSRKLPIRYNYLNKQAPLRSCDNEMDGPITVATKRGNMSMIDVSQMIAGLNVHEKWDGGSMPIHHAALLVYTTVLWKLAYLGADMNARDEMGMTPIMHMAQTGKFKLLASSPNDREKSVDVLPRDDRGRTVMYHLLSCKEISVKEEQISKEILNV